MHEQTAGRRLAARWRMEAGISSHARTISELVSIYPTSSFTFRLLFAHPVARGARMEFRFDIKKAMASVAFLMERGGGQLDMFLGLKSLYLADKKSLIAWGKTITGDEFRALRKGPVLWTIYQLFKGTGRGDLQTEWDEAFTERMNHSIRLRSPVSIVPLSQREREILSAAQDEINSMAPWDVADWLHETCPEWNDPGDHSLPIEPEVILSNAGRSPDEIERLNESENVFQQTKLLLGAR